MENTKDLEKEIQILKSALNQCLKARQISHVKKIIKEVMK